jgi:transposase
VQLRTALINSLKGIISRNCGCSLNTNKIKAVKEDFITPLLAGQNDLQMSGAVSKDCIDFLTGKIREIECSLKSRMTEKKSFLDLQTIPGVGHILALTILLETGDISRFFKVGSYSSYCRKVPSRWTSNSKNKGKGNTKNGNKYLAWAFSEAAELSKRFNDSAKAFYNRKAARTNRMVAHAALAHKLARASYYIMRDGVVFDEKKLFV